MNSQGIFTTPMYKEQGLLVLFFKAIKMLKMLKLK